MSIIHNKTETIKWDRKFTMGLKLKFRYVQSTSNQATAIPALQN